MGSQRVGHNLATEQQQTLSSKHPHLCPTPCLQDGNGDTLCPSCPEPLVGEVAPSSKFPREGPSLHHLPHHPGPWLAGGGCWTIIGTQVTQHLFHVLLLPWGVGAAFLGHPHAPALSDTSESSHFTKADVVKQKDHGSAGWNLCRNHRHEVVVTPHTPSRLLQTVMNPRALANSDESSHTPETGGNNYSHFGDEAQRD